MKTRVISQLLFLHIIYVSISSQNNDPPILNTRFVKIGFLHPRVDFAGVIIDLNVKDAISRGSIAIEMVNKYLVYHKKKQRVTTKWKGEHRHIHFMTVKRNKVLHNLRKLEADLHTATEQYKVPGVSTTIAPPSASTIPPRPKRGIDIDIDVTKCLSIVVNGIVALFSAPQSLDKIQKSVDKIAFRTSRLESRFSNFTTQVDLILKIMQHDITHSKDEVHMIASLNSALNLADDTIMELLTSITPLIKGELTHNLLDPLQSQQLIEETQTMADKFNLEVVATRPIDILQCSVTTFATKDTWFAMLSIPLVHKSETMQAFQFLNIPFFHEKTAVQWDIKEGVVARSSGLYPNIKNIFIPSEDLEQLCDKFNDNYLCHKRINHFPTCQISLMHHRTNQCSLKLADHRVRYSYGQFNYWFFQKPMNTLVECPNKEDIYGTYLGLLDLDVSQCTVTTTAFTLLPKSSSVSSVSSFSNKTSAVTIIDSEWLKVAVKFANSKYAKSRAEDPSNPWYQVTISSDDDQEVRIFGTHTILVNSIVMFFVCIIVLTLLAICVFNYLDYVPEFLRPPVTDCDSSHLSEDCNSIALPDL